MEQENNQEVQNISINLIIPNQFQPRLNFDEKDLEELASSIKQHGIIQPLVLRKINDKYEIIAGERRFRAACLVGLKTVPAIIKEIDDNTSAEIALIENVQRKNLTPIEEAKSYRNLLDKGFLTQEELAAKLGLSQSAVSNKLRLLNLDEEVQAALLSGKISERHARSLLNLSNKEEQKEWLNKVINERITVRQLDLDLKNYLGKDITAEVEKESSDIASQSSMSETNNQIINTQGITPTENIKTDNVIEGDLFQSFTPNVDNIVTNAKDILPKEEEKDLSKILQPSELQTIEENKTKPENNSNSSKIPNKFFNFLEDDEANMETEDISSINNEEIKPEIASEIPLNTVITTDLNSNQNLKTNTILEPTIFESSPVQTFEFPKVEEKKVDMEPEIDNNIYAQNMSQNNFQSELIDPIDLIETLSPDYEMKKQEERGLDLKTAINSVRSNTNELYNKGFNIEIEEIDLDDIYQFTIKVKK